MPGPQSWEQQQFDDIRHHLRRIENKLLDLFRSMLDRMHLFVIYRCEDGIDLDIQIGLLDEAIERAREHDEARRDWDAGLGHLAQGRALAARDRRVLLAYPGEFADEFHGLRMNLLYQAWDYY